MPLKTDKEWNLIIERLLPCCAIEALSLRQQLLDLKYGDAYFSFSLIDFNIFYFILC